MIKTIPLNSPDYPPALKNIYDPPAVLYVLGDLEKIEEKIILAVVGTRRATAYGKMVLEKLIPPLAQAGIIVVSGMAAGIDSWAHELTLKSGGTTWAVVAGGVDKIYPAKNRSLYQKILQNGAIISEHPQGIEPLTWHFPRRNRIISGLSHAVLVVEADYQSGAMITAKFAADQGREVLTVPGSIFNQNSLGPHWLIKQGAALVEKPEDIFEILQVPQFFKEPKKISPPLTEPQKKIIEVLKDNSLNADEIVGRTGLAVEQVTSEIMTLVILGLVKELPGQRYCLI